MRPTEMTKRHVISTYVEPERQRRETTVRARVGTVQKELGWTDRTPSVYSTLSSHDFQREAHVQLIEKIGGPTSGGPSTTVEFVYRLEDEGDWTARTAKPVSDGTRLRALYGLCGDTFEALGGGEEFLRREREWGPDAWERHDAVVNEEQQNEGSN